MPQSLDPQSLDKEPPADPSSVGGDRSDQPERLFEDQEMSLSDLSAEGVVAFVLFWALSIIVFVQFFSRYVLNDSIGWTEEIARYLLILVAFVGAAVAVQRNSHIFVEFFYRYLPPALGLWLSRLVDVLRIGFLAVASVITFQLAQDTNQYMTSIELPKSIIYYVVFAGFVAMTWRAVQVAVRHWRDRESPLTHPEFGLNSD